MSTNWFSLNFTGSPQFYTTGPGTVGTGFTSFDVTENIAAIRNPGTYITLKDSSGIYIAVWNGQTDFTTKQAIYTNLTITASYNTSISQLTGSLTYLPTSSRWFLMEVIYGATNLNYSPSAANGGVNGGTVVSSTLIAIPASIVPSTNMVAPMAPTISSATAGDSTVTLALTPPTNASTLTNGFVYQVETFSNNTYTTRVGSSYKATYAATTSSITVSGLTNNTPYWFKVYAKNTIGTTFATATATPAPPPPNPPTALSAVGDNGSILVSWSAPVPNGGSAVTGYRVTVNPGNRISDVGSNTLSTTISELTNGTTYTVAVIAINTAGNSSATSTTATPQATLPGFPTITRVLKGESSVHVRWTHGNDGGAALTGYRIWIADTDISANLAGSATSHLLTGLPSGQPFMIRLQASNSVGPGPVLDYEVSAPILDATRNTTFVAAASALAAGGSSVSFRETVNAQRGSVIPYVASLPNYNASSLYTATSSFPMTSKNVKFIVAADGESITVDTSTLTVSDILHIPGDAGETVTLVLGGVSYPLSFDASGKVVYSGTAYDLSAQLVLDRAYTVVGRGSAGLVAATVPGAPTGVTATAGDGQVALSWTAPVNDGGSAITGYTITDLSNNLSVDVSASTTSTTITGLTNGTLYTFTVKAINDIGSSDGATVTATPYISTIPDAPTNVTVTTTDSQVTVSWIAPASDGGSALIGYTITDSSNNITVDVSANVTSKTITGLTNGTIYRFTVVAENAIGLSVESSLSAPVIPTLWSQLGVSISGGLQNIKSGYSVSISDNGSVIAIGSPYDINGYVSVYAWNGTAWVQRGTNISANFQDGTSGYSVSLSADGSTVAFSTPSVINPRAMLGSVSIYTWNGTAWIQKGANIVGDVLEDAFGTNISLASNGLSIAIGSPMSSNYIGEYAGEARIYDWNGTAWVQRGASIVGKAANDRSGYVSLSANSNVVAICAGTTGWSSSGVSIRIFEWSGTEWIQRGADIDGENVGDRQGTTLRLSSDGNVVAITRELYQGQSARIFAWNGTSWVQRSTSTDDGMDISSQKSISLSADGSIVAIGAVGPYSANPTDGDVSLVRIYRWIGYTWVRLGDDILDNNTGTFENSIELSSDGSFIVFGSPYVNNSSGQVRVYGLNDAVLPVAATVPGAPTSVSTTAGDSQVTVSWTAPTSNGGSAITAYRVTNVTTSSTYDVSANVTTKTITGLTNGTTYSFTVKALNDIGYSAASSSVSAMPSASGGGGGAVVPCFFGNARVLTPIGYRRMDSLKVGDEVLTPQGSKVNIERVKVTVCPAGPNTNPYVIPAGTFGAERRVLISPDHKVCLSDGRRVEAKKLGLEQEEREGTLTYYNLELAGQADMVVSGVAVESLAPVRRVVMSLAAFEAAVKSRYGDLTPAVLANIKRTCRLVGRDAVEVPVLRR